MTFDAYKINISKDDISGCDTGVRMTRGNSEEKPILTSREFWILTSVLESPKHGYAIAKQVEEATEGAIHLSAGTLYENIHRMLESGMLVRDSENEVEPGVRRKRYRASALGQRLHQEYITLVNRAAILVPGISIQGT